MDDRVIAPRVRAVENMVARAIAKTSSTTSTPACAHCQIELWLSYFFDGTNNHYERDFPLRHSNVAALFEAHEANEDQGISRFYYEGVGTEFEFNERTIEQTYRLEDGTEHTVIRSGYRESESTRRQGSGSGIDIRLEKAIFEFEMYVAEMRSRKRVDAINVAAFGFSRGAATARAFANWLSSHSKISRSGEFLTFDGIPLRFRFLGIFDTVESVGLLAQNRRPHLVKTSLPGYVERCLHLTAAHELRPSFGLTGLGSNRYIQAVYPGAHSDVGGGYRDGEQGRSNMLSRIALHQMLDHARGAGLKMLSVDEMQLSDRWERLLRPSFDLDPNVVRDLSAYLSSVETRSGPIRAVFESHMRLFWAWLDSGLAAEANGEVFREHHHGVLAQHELAAEVRTELARILSLYQMTARTETGKGYGAITGSPRHPPERDAVPEAVNRFFRRYVHDSQAGFVLAGRRMVDTNLVNYYRTREVHSPRA